ncbi:hypothetical protein IEC97_21645 [Neobacillus cucumis]|uniref:hypothetical protein n=1 Tax=Neobacillus cucumis TaxID=1740721 RepID=UPI0018DF879E|nr:hypothetical protein [Neobacillus cucumis]MBI0579968.1 hypothetical protein [Neobacillus cucumis]
MNKDYIFGFLVMFVVMILTKDLNILDSWIITQIVKLLLGFIALIIASVIFKKIFSKN